MKMLRTCCVSLFFLFSVKAVALPADTVIKKTDTALWKTGGMFGVNFTQIALSNWAAGGQRSVSGTSLLNLFANYKNKKSQWDSTLDLGYGLISQGSSKRWIKSDDKIEISSKYGRQAFKKWFYTLMFSFRSQFAPGFDDAYKPDSTRKTISDFMAPGYFMFSLGMDFKINDHFTLLMSPLTSKITAVNNQTLANTGAFGVDKATTDASGMITTPGKRLRYEVGGYVKTIAKFQVMKNVNLLCKLELFSNYLTKPGNVDIVSEILIAMKINKYLSATINMHGLYDNDVMISRDTDGDGVADRNGPVFQFKEVLGIGFSVRFK